MARAVPGYVDRGDEVALLHGHREIDRVEVDFATEAAAEIRRRVDGQVALVTTRTQEYQLSDRGVCAATPSCFKREAQAMSLRRRRKSSSGK